VHHTPVHEIDAWHVDLQQVAVRRHSVIHEEAKIVELRGIVYLLPMRSAHCKPADAGDEVKTNQDPEARPIALVRGFAA
jgi:hypothetical protein